MENLKSSLYRYATGGAVGFDGSDLIREAGGGIVAVEVQYRLGLFGIARVDLLRV